MDSRVSDYSGCDVGTEMNRLRIWLAFKLASLARRLHPQNPQVLSFYADRMVEAAIMGASFVKITAVPREEIVSLLLQPRPKD